MKAIWVIGIWVKKEDPTSMDEHDWCQKEMNKEEKNKES